MSKESYVRGFCKAAEDAGVDPVALAKYAASQDAGIGSFADNFGLYEWKQTDTGKSLENTSKPHRGSYISALRKNDPWDMVARRANFFPHGIQNDNNGTITQSELENARKEVASYWAEKMFPRGTAPYKAIRANLIDAGERNVNSYKWTGAVEPRTVPDESGLDNINLPEIFERIDPDKRKKYESRGVKNSDDLIRAIQNTMVRKGVPSTGNIA